MRQRLQIYPIADKDFNKGHGEQLFRAFDKAFNVEVKYDTTKLHTSKSEISTNINAAGSRYISEDMLGKVGGEPNKSPSNLVQEKPSDSISQPAEDNVVGKVCPVECRRTAGIFLNSHARAPFFHNTLPNPCALAPPLWDDVESDHVIDGKDIRYAWQPKLGSSPIHPLSAGTKSVMVENRNTLEPETTVQMRIPADSNEEPDVWFAPHVSPSYSQHHYSHATASLPKWKVALHEVGASVPSDE